MPLYDYLIVGSGLFGSVFAYRAGQQGLRCLVIDKRQHTGGNVHCSDCEGICVHEYGPHIFHTDNRKVWEFVNQFTPFHQFTLCTIADFRGQLYPLPFNMHTFHALWGVVSPKQASEIIEQQRKDAVAGEPRNLEEQALSLVGRDVYETLIKGYTEKQWGRPCRELPSSIIQRLPVRLTYDNNYFNDRYQGIPEGGYNRLIDGLLARADVRLGCDYFMHKAELDKLAKKVVFTGRIDEYFGYCFGRLDYRSLRFERERLDMSNYQGNAIINYTDACIPYTRIVEHKHFAPHNPAVQSLPFTIITREYPLTFDKEGQDIEPYYPINDERNNSLYQKYRQLASLEPNVIFGGRLAEYRYYDMDEIVERALIQPLSRDYKSI